MLEQSQYLGRHEIEEPSIQASLLRRVALGLNKRNVEVGRPVVVNDTVVSVSGQQADTGAPAPASRASNPHPRRLTRRRLTALRARLGPHLPTIHLHDGQQYPLVLIVPKFLAECAIVAARERGPVDRLR